MYAAERHQLLAQRARRDGRVDVGDVAAELGVAPETIRRDLGVLERQGVVRRVYGGAGAGGRLDLETQGAPRGPTNPPGEDAVAPPGPRHGPPPGPRPPPAGAPTHQPAAPLPARPP